jgi:predicted NBD/HSP70 family sugar kinase
MVIEGGSRDPHESPAGERRSHNADVRRQNLATVLRIVLETGPISAVDIGERATLSEATAGQMVEDLVGADLIVAARGRRSGHGTAAAMYSGRPDLAYAVGVTMSASGCAAASCDIVGGSRVTVTSGSNAFPNAAAQLAELVRAALKSGEVPLGAVGAVVVGLPSPDEVASEHASIAQSLATRLGRPVEARVNVDLAARLEARGGAARECPAFVFGQVEPDLAVAAIAGGRIFLGSMALLAEGPARVDRVERLAEAVVTTALVLDADLIVLGGRSSTVRFDSVLGSLRSAAARRIPRRVRVVPALIDDNADLLGAVEAALARVRDNIVRDVLSGETPIAARR